MAKQAENGEAAREQARAEMRFLVDAYYLSQENRKRIGNQVTALGKAGKSNQWIEQFRGEQEKVEAKCLKRIRELLEPFVVGRWSQTVCGVGPVIAAGLIAHIDIRLTPTAGHIWRFAGLDPTSKWNKKEKRPWNADLKKLCWNIGECFVKVSARESDVYGKVYLERKFKEQARNEAGELAEQAAASLLKNRYGDDTKAKDFYQRGLLPPAHIHARAKRYAVKLFLAHWHHVAYETEYGLAPPKPYVIAHGGHTHFIAPPGWPMEEKKKKKRAKEQESAIVKERATRKESTRKAERAMDSESATL